MKIARECRSTIVAKLWEDQRVGATQAEAILNYIIDEQHYSHDVLTVADIQSFFDSVLRDYLFPQGLNRLDVLDEKELSEKGVILDYVKTVVVGGWELKIYFDSSNQLYWEDNPGRYGAEGYRVSPYVDPISFYSRG